MSVIYNSRHTLTIAVLQQLVAVSCSWCLQTNTHKAILQVSWPRMQLAYFILSLQLAYTASAGESVRFGENAGLRRRQSSSILQAGQVQEEGGVRLSRNRARLRSRQPEIINTTEEDNKVVIDAEKHDKKENRKGVRKGVKKSAKKKASDGLLKQQILNRLVTIEPVQIAKVSYFKSLKFGLYFFITGN